MAQHDYNIGNADGATVRADINSLAEAIASHNSGSGAPSVTFPYMLWADTASGQMKQRDGTNTSWITLYSLSGFPSLTTGDAVLTLKSAAATGFVMMNDGTIGSASSGATTRANADTEALYTLIWNNVSNTYAAVTGGRGANAAADFAANKAIALTKQLGRAIGIAGAGSGLTSRVLGLTVGEESHALTSGENGAHNHGITDPGHYHFSTSETPYTSGGAAINSSTGFGAADLSQLNSYVTFSASTGISINNSGSGTAHNTMQPTAFWNVMIKL